MKKNILVIDDSALMRRLLSDIINSDDRFVVEDVATNGLEALNFLVKDYGKYDAVIMDINMPKMNGHELLEQLQKHRIKAKVIVVSTVAKEGAIETIRALELGAFDFVTKPCSFIDAKSESFSEKILLSLTVATNTVNKALITKNTSIVNINTNTTKENLITRNEITLKKKFVKSVANASTKKIVALACSTGGPKALQSVVPYLPANLDAPVLIVQHMPEGFTNSLATRLNEISKINVKEAEHGEIIKKGWVYIAKGGYQMRVKKLSSSEYQLLVTLEAPRNGLKPCADIMYESLLDTDYDEITCVILTGMGGDGTKGIKQLEEKKNIYVIAQDEPTCTVYGMPKVVKEAGLVDEVQPLTKVQEAITKNVGVR
ncbi:chemotaxis-specific protein-glutamate methyltransferase CheB [Anaeromicropila herbilytica]|uniref:Protein-glutamate methylesterase/protein-glutamine glutaminase n=1 Tax=Anaeromicropila herbilytica TaxID=2785025 RepID=A0A7R7EMG9_9FIRM|nr:chemotaxis-specific protein-glutamate methyltransferase CheB [Anaeromicropila herbilytica]BCN31512.1 chemotaxis response regulator protein-glutamate methylesterase [Anaeromicropila herbilytica]